MDTIRKIIVFLVISTFSYSVYGQTDHGYNIYGQLLGSSTGVGIGLDSRFKTGGVLGYSVGIGFTSVSWDTGFLGSGKYMDVDSKGVSIPLEINAIMGKRASKFEVGLGLTAYLIQRNELHGYSGFVFSEDGETMGYYHESYRRSIFRPNIVGTLDIGYRLQRKSGFFMRLGLTMLIGDLKCSPIDGLVVPNICLGYTIPHF